MTDHFAVLDQPRRPWLDPEQLKKRYYELTFAHHPDREQQCGNLDFATIIDAYRVLSSPRLRLHHLLELENKNSSATTESDVAADLTDTFMETAALLRELDQTLHKRQAATDPLSKSLLETETAAINQRAEYLSNKLQTLAQKADEDLRRVDTLWTANRRQVTNELPALAQRFAYLERWISQLKERQFQLLS